MLWKPSLFEDRRWCVVLPDNTGTSVPTAVVGNPAHPLLGQLTKVILSLIRTTSSIVRYCLQRWVRGRVKLLLWLLRGSWFTGWPSLYTGLYYFG